MPAESCEINASTGDMKIGSDQIPAWTPRVFCIKTKYNLVPVEG